MTKTTENNSRDYIGQSEGITDREEDDQEFGLEQAEPLTFELDWSMSDERLDKVLARLMPDVSRARIQGWIESGAVLVGGQNPGSVRRKVGAGETITVYPQPSAEDLSFEPRPGIEFEVIHEDADILVVNKPAGLAVHPTHNHQGDTLANQAAAHLGGIGTAAADRGAFCQYEQSGCREDRTGAGGAL